MPAAAHGSGGSPQTVRNLSDPGGIPLVEGGAQLSKVDGDPVKEALHKAANQRRGTRCVQPPKLGQAALVEHRHTRLGRNRGSRWR
jgi:hypothetical protein